MWNQIYYIESEAETSRCSSAPDSSSFLSLVNIQSVKVQKWLMGDRQKDIRCKRTFYKNIHEMTGWAEGKVNRGGSQLYNSVNEGAVVKLSAESLFTLKWLADFQFPFFNYYYLFNYLSNEKPFEEHTGHAIYCLKTLW